MDTRWTKKVGEKKYGYKNHTNVDKRMSRYGAVLPSGMTSLNVLGLSTQVPMNYTYLTTGSERTIKLTNRQVVLKRGVPKNFCYETCLIALLVQALRTLKQDNVGSEELQTIRTLIANEPDKETLSKDVDKMPAWMKRIVKPMLKTNEDNE